MDREQIEAKAAEITSDVISAYEEAGWTPVACAWNPLYKAGCAVGVLQKTASSPQVNPYEYVQNLYGLTSGFRFGIGFDMGYKGREEPYTTIWGDKYYPIKDPHYDAKMIGHIVGRNIRAWKALRDTETVQPQQKVMEVV